MNNSIAEEIEKLNKEKVRIESELDIYRNDYLTLTTCEDELARIYSIAENSDYTLECFSASINSTAKYKDEQKYPGLDALFDFKDEVNLKKEPLQKENNDFMIKLNNMLIEIDEIKETDAKEIERLNNELNGIIDRINALREYNSY